MLRKRGVTDSFEVDLPSGKAASSPCAQRVATLDRRERFGSMTEVRARPSLVER